MVPPAPAHVQKAAAKLKYRDFLIVTLILKKKICSQTIGSTSIHPKSRLAASRTSDPGHPTCFPTASIRASDWNIFATKAIGFGKCRTLSWSNWLRRSFAAEPGRRRARGRWHRYPPAESLPVYDHEYQQALDVIRKWLENFPNLQLVGRNGMHRYNNQDHSMLTAMLAVKNILGEKARPLVRERGAGVPRRGKAGARCPAAAICRAHTAGTGAGRSLSGAGRSLTDRSRVQRRSDPRRVP